MAPTRGTLPDTRRLSLESGWSLLSVAALGVSALYALVLVVLRTSTWSDHAAAQTLFERALAVHVQLSLGIWLLTASAAFIVAGLPTRPSERVSLGATGMGACLVAVAPLFPGGEVWLHDYFPVLTNPPFLVGAMLVFCGVLFNALRGLLSPESVAVPDHMRHAVRVMALGLLLVFVTSLLAWIGTDAAWPLRQRLWAVSWAGGHALQLLYMQAMLLAWCHIAGLARSRVVVLGLYFGLLPLLVTTLLSVFIPAGSQYFTGAFTRLMELAGWYPMVALAWLFSQRQRHPWPAALGLSAFLYIAGVSAGIAIIYNNTLVPAHYHGTVGAVTVALLAMISRRWLRAVGERAAWRMEWLVRSHGSGLLVLLAGFAWISVWGAERKSSGLALGGPWVELIGYALVAIGGAIAVTSVLLFSGIAIWRLIVGEQQTGRQLPLLDARQDRG